MIQARFFRTPKGTAYGFDITNHGDPIVCAAVSALSINCANSIDKFTGIDVDIKQGHGQLTVYLHEIEKGAVNEKCDLLLQSLLLGLRAVQVEHPSEIRIRA